MALRILEVPMPYRRRSGGVSKVAGTIRGSLRAGMADHRDISAGRGGVGGARAIAGPRAAADNPIDAPTSGF